MVSSRSLFSLPLPTPWSNLDHCLSHYKSLLVFSLRLFCIPTKSWSLRFSPNYVNSLFTPLQLLPTAYWRKPRLLYGIQTSLKSGLFSPYQILFVSASLTQIHLPKPGVQAACGLFTTSCATFTVSPHPQMPAHFLFTCPNFPHPSRLSPFSSKGWLAFCRVFQLPSERLVTLTAGLSCLLVICCIVIFCCQVSSWLNHKPLMYSKRFCISFLSTSVLGPVQQAPRPPQILLEWVKCTAQASCEVTLYTQM